MKSPFVIPIIHDESAAVMVEYALVLSLLSFAFIGGMKLVEGATDNAMTTVESGFLSYALRSGN